MTTDRLILDTFVPYRLSVVSNLVSDGIARIYRSLFGLSIPEWRVVAVTAEMDGATQQQICLRTRMDKVTVSRAVIALERRELLERRANPADGRSHWLYLTASGQSLYDGVAPKALELERQIFDGFDAAELANLMAMLDRVEQTALTLRNTGTPPASPASTTAPATGPAAST